MTLKIAGIWCNSKSDFDKYCRKENFDVVVSYNEIYSRLLKSDPGDNAPSDVIISLYIQKLFRNIPIKFEGKAVVNAAFLFKNLDTETIDNFIEFINDVTEDIQIDLVIINRSDYPKSGILSKFDNVRFIEND